MKKIISAAILMACMTTAFGEKTKSNATYFKVFVLNEQNQLLMVNFKGSWEPIGGTYASELTIEDAVKELVGKSRVQCGEIRLRGLFSVYYSNKGGLPYAYHYYTVRHTGGEVIPPSDCEDAAWFSPEEVMDKIAFKDMGRVFEQIQGNDHLWSGSWIITKNRETKERTIEIKKDFFILN